jgi:phage terminase Nu1 subunit (DNA packaging protein)
MHEHTLNRLAEMFEKDRASLARAMRNVPRDAGTEKRPLYRVATAVKALIAHEVKPDGRQGHGDTARLANERAALARAQTESVELKNEMTRGNVISVETVIRSYGIIVAAVRERLLSIPGKVAAACEMRSRGEVHEIVQAEIFETLEELSRPVLFGDPPSPGDGKTGDDDTDDGNEAA